MSRQDIVPYTAISIDADWKHFVKAVWYSVYSSHDRTQLIESICSQWISDRNLNPVIPCLSVRSGFDLFLRVLNYPPGTEVIMSAVNIPDMIQVVHAHGLRVVSLDVDLETMAPKMHLLESLVTERTRMLVVASIYGRRFNMAPVVSLARSHGLMVVEDAAEGFGGFDYIGYEGCDLALFSFGAIKHHTAFGGGIAKVRSRDIYEKMCLTYEADPVQPHTEYLKKTVKYAIVHIIVDCPHVTKPLMHLTRLLNIDHKKHVVSMLRGFPDKLMVKLRHRPCDALLAMMALRHREVDPAGISMSNLKHDYVYERLPSTATGVGLKADVRNHWLFPVVVEQPDEVVRVLNFLGVDAYRGATQLNIVEPDNGDHDHVLSPLSNLDKFITRYPHEAKYLIDHVIYLPVNKSVPFHELDRICQALSVAMESCCGDGEISHPQHQSSVKLKSKL